MSSSASTAGWSCAPSRTASESIPKLAYSRIHFADIANISVSTVDREIKSGTICACLALRRILVSAEELKRFVHCDPEEWRNRGNNTLDILTRHQAAIALDLSTRTVDRLIKRGLIKPTPYGAGRLRCVRIAVEELCRFLRDSTTQFRRAQRQKFQPALAKLQPTILL